MHHALGDRESLSRTERDGLPLEVDLEAAVNDIEELVLIVVLVPVELPLQDTEPYNAVIHPAERLVVPRVLACVDERLDVDELKVAYRASRWIE